MENAHQAAVSPEVFKKVQKAIKSRHREQGSTRCHSSPNLDFTHFKRHKRGNLQYDGTEWRGVSVHRSWRSIVKNPPTPTTSGYAQR